MAWKQKSNKAHFPKYWIILLNKLIPYSCLQTSHFILKRIVTSALRDVLFFFAFIQYHTLSGMRMFPTIHCLNVIQFREMFAAAAKSHCYTLRHPIWKKPPKRLYNHSERDKSCLVLILRSSCSQNTTTMHFRGDEPVSCGREGNRRWTQEKIFTHENDVYSTGLSMASYREEEKKPLRLY